MVGPDSNLVCFVPGIWSFVTSLLVPRLQHPKSQFTTFPSNQPTLLFEYLSTYLGYTSLKEGPERMKAEERV
jgi:hypothetical protein